MKLEKKLFIHSCRMGDRTDFNYNNYLHTMSSTLQANYWFCFKDYLLQEVNCH